MGDTTMMVSLKMLNWTPIPSKFPFKGSSASFNSSAEKYTEWGSRSRHVHNCLLCQRFNVNAVDVQLIHIPHQRPKFRLLQCQLLEHGR